MVDKNKEFIKYLMGCDEVKDNPLFFNFGDSKNNSNHLITNAVSMAINKPFVDGSVMMRYSFTIIGYKSLTYLPVAKTSDYPSENVDDFINVQEIIDWINEQDRLHNYPDFGSECVIEKIYVGTNVPNLNGIDTGKSPPIAKYSIVINIDYLDISNTNWNK